MRARDIMTRPVVTVGPKTSVADIAQLLLDRQISAVPVIDSEGVLVGIVSEGDLIRRVESDTVGRQSWWLRTFAPKDDLAREFIRSRGATARDVMTFPVITVSEETPVREIAELLETRRVKRVPVTRDGSVVGIVSRANLLHAVAAGPHAADSPASDSAIRESIVRQMRDEAWANDVTVNVTVEKGVVSYWGLVGSPVQREALRVLAEATEGVREVRDYMTLFESRQSLRD